ncbi:MAG: MTH938/NDUFAF3 family protein [Pseudomonadota bacterium]
MVRDAALKFTRDLPGALSIRSVGPNGIRVMDELHEESIVLAPDAVLHTWHDTPVEALAEDDFERVFAAEPEIVVLGTGGSHMFPPREIMFAFARRSIGFEFMDTAAAARTFNVLANEGRKVVAVLYLG